MSVTAPHELGGSRHNVYLSGEERVALERVAAEHAASLSYVLRVGLRLLVGLPVPAEFERKAGGASAR